MEVFRELFGEKWSRYIRNALYSEFALGIPLNVQTILYGHVFMKYHTKTNRIQYVPIYTYMVHILLFYCGKSWIELNKHKAFEIVSLAQLPNSHVNSYSNNKTKQNTLYFQR